MKMNRPILSLKLVAMAKPPNDRQKVGQTNNLPTKYLPFGEKLMKIGRVDTEIKG